MSQDLLPSLLSGDDPPAFTIENADATSDFVLVCDHAGRRIPRQLENLGLGEAALASHIAWDIGIADTSRRLAARLDATLINQNYSRLVIDANRPLESPESIVTLSETTAIPGNEGLDDSNRAQRVRDVFDPYHDQIRRLLDRREADGRAVVLVALHSFTPVYRARARAWHAGVLYNRDARLARYVLDELRRDSLLIVGENEPYSASDATDYTIVFHGEARGLPHVELEVRQDLLSDASGREEWAERFSQRLDSALRAMRAG